MMSDGQTQGCQKAYKTSQVMQIAALLLLSLFSLGQAQVATPEATAEPQALAEANPDGSVSYLLTYDEQITYSALQTKCHNLNCTRIICGVINALVVDRDPTAVSTLSADPLLSAQNINQQVSLDYIFHDYVTIANASLERRPPWHLDRLNQIALPLDGFYESNLTGVGAHIYLIDTGIQSNHSEFLNADATGTRVVSGEWSFDGSNITEDCNGHGTATASLAGGRTVGTSPNATLHAIRAIGCDGTANIADIIAAINYVALNAIRPAVISMSVGTPMLSEPLQTAVNNTVSLYNLSIVAAAGNDASDSCVNTPSRSVYVQSVGATTIEDDVAVFSNRGKCVNVYAPGAQIYCANMDSGFQVISGTSMSCPLASGIVAQYYEFNSTLQTWDITDILYKSRTRGLSPNRGPPIIVIPPALSLLTGGIDVCIPSL